MIEIKELLINGIDYSDYATIPLQTQDTLDESLDMAYLELKGLENESPFVPFSDVYLKITDKDNNIKEMYMFIESDEVTHIIGINKYNHNILLIEETKWLERFFVEKSITNPLIHDYSGAVTRMSVDNISYLSKVEINKPATGQVKAWMYDNLDLSMFNSVEDYNSTLIIPNVLFDDSDYLDYKFIEGTLTITEPDTNVLPEIELEKGVNTNFTLSKKGIYTFKFHYLVKFTTAASISSDFEFEIFSYEQIKPKKDYTIKEVLNILLLTTETLRQGEKPKFELAEINDYNESEDYKDKVKKILEEKSPEFYFSKMSLFEALKIVGDYAHFIPRMKNRKIYLDLLGMEDKENKIEKENYYSYTASQNTNDFCTKLDSQVNNLVNLDSDQQGSVITPFNDGLRTFRMEEGNVQITDEGIIIPTENPIEKIHKLEIGFLKDGTFVGDIKPYVYESAEYEVLSSYSNSYPNSKMYALKYTAGSPNITGLTFKRQNAISESFENIAIKNIIYRKLNKGINWWNNLWENEDVFKLQYRLVYTPNTSTRITQSKAYKNNITKSVSIAYNQSASKISSNAYGENLKGQVLKMGNAEINKMFLLPSLDLIPRCGLKFDENYYISVVKCEYYPNFIKCEIGLSKDYNNKSAYIEVNSQLRFYEISEKIAYDIYRIYEDYCEIGFDSETDNNALITNDGIDKFKKCFNYGYRDTNLTMVKADCLDNKNEIIATTSGNYASFVFPVISLGVGNSLLFEYHYVDNFSGGLVAERDNLIKIQKLLSYTDIYGEVENLSLKYGINKLAPQNREEAITMGDNLPLAQAVTEMETYFDTGNNPIILKKDNREAIHFTYQIHFVANNNNLIIGSGLARYSTFVTNEAMNYKLVLLKERLSKFESEIDLTNAYFYDSIETIEDYDNKKIKLSNVIAPENEEWKSWAIVQTILNDKNEIVKAILILGENKDIKSGDIIEMPNFVFKHKIVEE